MENKNESEFGFDFGYYRHTAEEKHRSEINIRKEFIKNHKHDKKPTDEVKKRIEEFKEDNKYHKMRKECIKKYSNEKKVPKINVPDKYFSEYSCHRDKPSEEKLYSNNKEISLYENGNFVVYQTHNTCYFMASILGLIDQGKGNYIKEKMVREYKEDPTKAIVRLRDEDGLPVDIIVDKTRFGYCNRPLWLIMLEKAVCVMMNTNKFGFAESYRLPAAHADIVTGVNWYKIEEKQKKGEEVFLPGCFKMNDIGNSGEATGFKLLFGKKVVDKNMFILGQKKLQEEGKLKEINKENIAFLRYFLSRNKLVIGSSIGLDHAKMLKGHVMYFKSYDEHYVYGIESLYGNFKVPIAEFNKMRSIYAAEFPGDEEKSKKAEIEDHQENKQTNKIENNSSVVLNNKTSDSENKIDSPETTKIKTENITYSKNDNGSNNLGFTADKTNISITENQTNINIKSNEKNEINKKDNTNKNQNVLHSGTKENTKNKQFINWKFIMLGVLFLIGSVLAFYCDVYLFISIISLIVGLLFIFLGTKSKLGNYLARKFFDFSPPKQNKIGNTFDKSCHRTKNNNLSPEQIINSGTSHELKKSD